MEEFHKEAFPETSNGQDSKPLKINVRTLDAILASKDLHENILFKLDVQGFELEAIAGASETLARSKVVVIEMSFAQLYEGQPLFHDVYQSMYDHGFRFRGSLAQMLHPQTGEIVQTDTCCKLLDPKTARCKDYKNRKKIVPDCIQLTPKVVEKMDWLPKTCGYRLVHLGQDLYWWHPLISGDPETVHQAGISARGRVISEDQVEDISDRVVDWFA
jgi:uncharacterized cysteine cluster protein YcgN (CxxCxxCC family)